MGFKLQDLDEIDSSDLNPYSGRLFAYVYETGDEELRKLSKEALYRFYDRNVLDFTVFRSAIFFEKEVVSFSKNLVHADENAAGSFTFGGTESILLAVKAARERFRANGGAGTPEIVVPASIHPSFFKAAEYFGMKVLKASLTGERKVDASSVRELLSNNTAMIAVSAPNWPFGTVDPVSEVADAALNRDVPLHVDACLGGFMLPFMERAGEKVEPFDFRIDGVTSLSMDVHKYGYSPKGASVVLFRDPEMKKHSMYVDVTSPGYIFVNAGVLSSRSVGPMAAAYATINYLGEKGYLNLMRRVLSARKTIRCGLENLGFNSIAPVESSILAMSRESSDLFSFVTSMREKGWHFHLQKGMSDLGIPENIHLTVSPVHESLAEEFVKDSGDSISTGSTGRLEQLIGEIKSGNFDNVMREFTEGKIDSSVVPILLDVLPEDVATEIVKEIVVNWYN